MLKAMLKAMLTAMQNAMLKAMQNAMQNLINAPGGGWYITAPLEMYIWTLERTCPRLGNDSTRLVAFARLVLGWSQPTMLSHHAPHQATLCCVFWVQKQFFDIAVGFGRNCSISTCRRPQWWLINLASGVDPCPVG